MNDTFIKKLQDKPLKVRQQILMLVSCGVTGFIVIIWFATLGLKSGGIAASVQESVKPFAVIKDNVVQVYANATKGLESAQAPVSNQNNQQQ